MFLNWVEGKAAKRLGEIGMPKGKLKHAIRVRDIVKTISADKDIQRAALLHDLIEQGGDIETAKRLFDLSDRAVNIIKHLSIGEDMEQETTPNAPLAHIQMILNSQDITSGEKQIVVIIKIADRLDNLTRRINTGGVGKNYSIKSSDLLRTLFDYYYTNYGKDKPIKELFEKYENVNNQIRKKRQMDLKKPWKGFKEWFALSLDF